MGHAYTLYCVDAIARASRQLGGETYFTTGTDEHGEKLQLAAARAGQASAAWVDEIVTNVWQPLPALLGAEPDAFIRTTSAQHRQAVQAFLVNLHERGHIYLGEHIGAYCVDCEERKSASTLIRLPGGEQACAIHKSPVKQVSERNYFFRLSSFTDRLRTLILGNPDFIQPAAARNEVLALLDAGLEDLSISRTNFDWGISVPWDQEHVVYVWFDALLNYVSALGYDGASPALPDLYRSAVHVIGKDILRFHALVLPALLLAHELVLPKQVIAHGWLLAKGEKVAKSRANAPELAQLVQCFGTDALRYHLLSTIPLGADGNFNVADVATTYEAILANGYGNLARRLTTLLIQHSEAKIERVNQGVESDCELIQAALDALTQLTRLNALNSTATRVQLGESLVRATNQYLTQQEPWKLAKVPGSERRVDEILAAAAYATAAASWVLAPLLPRSTQAVLQALGSGEGRPDDPQALAGNQVTLAPVLFPKLNAQAISELEQGVA